VRTLLTALNEESLGEVFAPCQRPFGPERLSLLVVRIVLAVGLLLAARRV
jgi:hypothetical protein